MKYSKPTVLATLNASGAIHQGNGNSAMGLPKRSSMADYANGPAPHLSTTGAYEDDE